MNDYRILVVDDEEDLCEILKFNLENEGYEVDTANSAEEALKMDIGSYNLLLLDVMMGEISGFKMASLLKKDKKTAQVPIIFITAKDTENDTVTGFNLGADDYITKPFGTSELLARLRTAIRHARVSYLTPEGMQTGTFRSGDLVIDYDKHRVYVGEQDAGLTQNEYKIVSLLGKYAGKVLTYDFLIKEIWGPNMKNDNRILRVNMANIRRKIEHNPAQPQYIFTEVGVGYRIVDPD